MDSSSATWSTQQGIALLRSAVGRELASRPPLGVVRLAQELGIDKGRTSRLVQELLSLELLQRDEDGNGFRVGPAYFALGASLTGGWVGQSRAVLRDMVARWGLATALSVQVDVSVLVIRAERASAGDGSGPSAGMVTPVWCTGAGRALLLDHHSDELELMFTDVEFVGVGGPYAAHTAEEVYARVEHDRARGVVVADSEFEHEVLEVAAPVRDERGAIVAAVSLLGKRATMPRDLKPVAASVTEAARTLSNLVSSQSGGAS